MIRIAITIASLAIAAAQADTINFPPIEPTCIAPLLWHTSRCECPDGQTPTETSYATFICPAPSTPAARGCIITITYPLATPTRPVLTRATGPGCEDDAELDAALLTLLLSRRLGAP